MPNNKTAAGNKAAAGNKVAAGSKALKGGPSAASKIPAPKGHSAKGLDKQ